MEHSIGVIAETMETMGKSLGGDVSADMKKVVRAEVQRALSKTNDNIQDTNAKVKNICREIGDI